MGSLSVKLSAASFVISLLVLAAFAAQANELCVTVTGVRSDTGEILIGLYGNAQGFEGAIANAETSGMMPDHNRLVGMAIRAKSGARQAIFAQLPPGRYAVIVIHDENDDGRLDANAFGMPTEGYGFSNDAHGFLSAPSFDAAAIVVGDADKGIAISLTYPPTASSDDLVEYNRFFGGSQAGK